MNKLGLLVFGLAISFALPASAETVIVKKGGHHGGYGARAEMRGPHGAGMRDGGDMHRGMRMHGNRTVVIKRGHHRY